MNLAIWSASRRHGAYTSRGISSIGEEVLGINDLDHLFHVAGEFGEVEGDGFLLGLVPACGRRSMCAR